MIEQIAKVIAPLHRRVRGMVARGVLALVDDANGVQRVQVQVGEQTLDGLDRPQQFGFSSHPPAGSEVVVVFVGGNRDHGVIVSEGDRAHRPTAAEPGTVTLYDGAGHRITLTPNGIAIDGGGHTLTLTNCPKLTHAGDLEVTGDVKAGTVSLRSHVHSAVQPGGGNSGGPVA